MIEGMHKLNKIWLKASVIGASWAALEIVLGSFLHNVRFPFSGSILTVIGLILLISVSYIWKEKGLYWRAGLICAVMKSISPSAVIFGPMIAIFTEAFLLQLSVWVFGRTILAFIIGSSLAMSWVLVQRLFNFILFYGYDIVKIYTNLMEFAERQLRMQFDFVWIPIIILLTIYIFLGFVATFIGVKIGRKIREESGKLVAVYVGEKKSEELILGNEFNYSIVWFFGNIGLIILGMVLLNFTTWPIWSVSFIAIVIVWVLRYSRALRQLSKPKFWIYFVLITMLSSFIFTGIQSISLFDGLLVGIQMNFRATILIIGFSVLGTELYNPSIRNFFRKTYLKQFHLALEFSFSILPSVIKHTPDIRQIIKTPFAFLYHIIAHAEMCFAKEEEKLNRVSKVFIITGDVEQGKTMLIKEVVDFLQTKDQHFGGFYSERILKDKETIGYDIVDVISKKREKLLRMTSKDSLEKIGHYFICKNGFKEGNKLVEKNIEQGCDIHILDEIGLLELDEGGWFQCFNHLVNENPRIIVIVVRKKWVSKVISKWKLENAIICNVLNFEGSTISQMILSDLNLHQK